MAHRRFDARAIIRPRRTDRISRVANVRDLAGDVPVHAIDVVDNDRDRRANEREHAKLVRKAMKRKYGD